VVEKVYFGFESLPECIPDRSTWNETTSTKHCPNCHLHIPPTYEEFCDKCAKKNKIQVISHITACKKDIDRACAGFVNCKYANGYHKLDEERKKKKIEEREVKRTKRKSDITTKREQTRKKQEERVEKQKEKIAEKAKKVKARL